MGLQTRVERLPLVGPWLKQAGILLWRNSLLQTRYWPSTLAQTIIAPFIFALLLYVLQQADYAIQSRSNPHPLPSTLQGVLPCQGRNPGDPCITLMYYPATPVNGTNFTQILEKFSSLNEPRIGRKLSIQDSPLTDSTVAVNSILDIVPVSGPDFIYDYIARFPNRTRWGITFNTSFASTGAQNIQYQVWYNASATNNVTATTTDIFGRDVLAMTRGMDEAIIAYLNDPLSASINPSLSVNLRDWPVTAPEVLSDVIVQQLGPVFFFCSEMIIFINVLSQVMTEKEMKLRHGMELMGMKPAVYWLTQYLSSMLLVTINAFLATCFGLMFGFQAFRNCNFGVMFFTFFFFGSALIMFAFFLTSIVREARQAVLIGIFFFIIGLLFETFVFSSAFLGYIWWAPNLIDSTGWLVLMFIPFFNFGHMFLDITTYTTGRLDTLTQTYIPGPGFAWSNLYEQIPKNLMPSYDGQTPDLPVPVQAWYFLIMNTFVYMILAWYLDNVIPDMFGASKPLYFFLLPEYWGFKTRHVETKRDEWLVKNVAASKEDNAEEDDDVATERQEAKNPGSWPAVKVVNLRKVYSSLSLCRGSDVKVAVRNSCITFEQGQLFALLGQNGAGKSTTISMLSGLTPATGGDALIFGLSVQTQMSEIRSQMGICPQHDILFDDLTAREHIQLYAGLKGVTPAQMSDLITQRLQAVRLDTVADVRAGTYSGGMKRRLSLVISTIGDPKIVFMDEPTTGMDPVNRRHVWSFVEKFKKDRVIVLTTHSMEEADVLGDRIAIMSKGEFKALGNSIRLKNKFGTGYRISVVCSQSDMPAIKKSITDLVPGANLEDDSAGALIYQFPPSSTTSIPKVVQWLESSRGALVKNWGISQSTLEEVFLKLIRASNPTNKKSE